MGTLHIVKVNIFFKNLFQLLCIVIEMVIVSLCNKSATVSTKVVKLGERPKPDVIISWVMLAVVMIALYIFFNGH